MKTRKIFLPLCVVLGASALAGCGGKHAHNFVAGHDEHSHYEICECGEKQNVQDHVFHTSTEPATCDHGNLTIYTCDCGYSYQVDDNKLHNYVQAYDQDNHWNECSGCHDKKDITPHEFELVSSVVSGPGTSLQTYKCKFCDYSYTADGVDFETHRLVSSIKKVATCQEKGIKVYKCLDCDYSFEEEYTDYNAHKWDAGTLDGGVTTYHCQNDGCYDEKVAISHKSEIQAKVDVSDLLNVGKLELKEATIDFGSDTLAGLVQDVTVAAEKVEATKIEASISDETKELIQNAPIFDFSMKNGEGDIHEFNGNLTVTVPYTLRDGEDPDNIGVVYINEKGETENIAAQYSNGFVSFETNHFSYYAVIEMTREEACALLGHNYFVFRTIPSTCERQGYIHRVCKRCGESEYEMLPLLDHHYVLSSSVASTTTKHGYNEYKCSVCGDTYRTELPLVIQSDDGYLATMIKTALDDGFTVEEGTADGDYNSLLKMIYRLGENPVSVLIREGELYSFSMDGKGYSLDSFTSHTDNSLAEMSSIANSLKSLPAMDKVFEYVQRVFDKVGIVKSSKDGLAHLNLNKEIANDLLNKINTMKAQELLDYILGEGTYEKALALVERSFARPLSETLDEVKEFGIDPKAVFNFVKSLPIRLEDDYEDIFTDEMLAKNGSELIKMLSGQDIAFNDLKAYADQYKDQQVMDIIASFVYEDPDQFKAEFNKIAKAYIENISFDITTMENGQLLEASFEVPLIELRRKYDDYYCKNHVDEDHDGYCDECYYNIEDYDNSKVGDYVLRKSGVGILRYSHDVAISQYEDVMNEHVNKINEIKDDFIIDEDHPFIKNVLEDYFGLEFHVEKNLKFNSGSYHPYYPEEEDVDTYYYVSEYTTKYTPYFKEHYMGNSDIYGQDSISARIIIPVRNSFYYYNDDQNSMLRFFSRLGEYSNLCKGRLGVEDALYSSGILDYNLYFEYENKNVFSSASNKLYNYFTIFYDLDKEEFSYKPSYLCEHDCIYKQISSREYYERCYGPGYSYDEEHAKQYNFYEAKCKNCDYITYDRCWKDEEQPTSGNGYLMNDNFNDEALKYRFRISHNNDYSSSKLSSDNFRVEVTGLYDFNNTFYVLDETRRNYENAEFNFGNVNIKVEYKNRNSKECWKNEIVTISCDGKVIKTFTNIIHNDYFDYHYEVLETYTEGCYDYEKEARICDCCGEIIYISQYTTGVHHKWVLVGTEQPTEAIPGKEFYECSECGATRNDYISTHVHNFEQNESKYSDNLYHCDCGRAVEEIPFHDFAVEDVTEKVSEYDSWYDDCYIYAISDHMHEYFNRNSYQLVAVGVNEEGEIDTNYMLSFDMNRFTTFWYNTNVYSSTGYQFENTFDGTYIEKETLDNFKASLPEDLEFDLRIIRFTNIDPVEAAEMDAIASYACTKFGVSEDAVQTLDYEDYNYYYSGKTFDVNITLNDCDDFYKLRDRLHEELIPDYFSHDYWDYDSDAGYIDIQYFRYYRYNTFVRYEFNNIEIKDGVATADLHFQVFKRF